MLRVDIISHHMDVDPSGLDKEDVERIENMLKCMLDQRNFQIIDSYLENAVFENEDCAYEQFQKFLDATFPNKKFSATEFIIDCCKFVEV